MRLAAALLAILTLLGACSGSNGGASGPSQPTTAKPIASTALPDTTPPPPDGATLMAGYDYAASEVEINGSSVPLEVRVTPSNNRTLAIQIEGPAGGSYDYSIRDGKLVLAPGPVNFDAPTSTPGAAGQKVQDTFESKPTISIDGDTVTITGDQARFVLLRLTPENGGPAAPTNVNFVGLTATASGIDPKQVSLVFPTFFFIEVQLESCVAHALNGGMEADDPHHVIHAVSPQDCPDPTAADQAVLDLLNAQPTMTYADGRLTITAPDGTNLVLESD